MNNLASISVALLFVCSVLAETSLPANCPPRQQETTNGIEVVGDEPKYTKTADGPAPAADYSARFSHDGVYGGGKLCKWGCCSESYAYSHPKGGYYECTCCASPFEAMAYKQRRQRAAEPKN